jgi:hypothetical protein
VSSTAASAADEKVASLPRLPDDTDLDLLA